MAKYPAIPEPTVSSESLRDSVLSLKQAFEILTGQRGNAANAAITSDSLPAFGDDIASLQAALNATTAALSAYVKLAGNQNITGGYTLTPYNAGTISSGTNTPNAVNGNYQYYTNGGAHTVAAPASDCAIDILITNNASAGAITFSGFTVNANTGEPLTTTNGHKFILSLRRLNGTSTYVIKALQ